MSNNVTATVVVGVTVNTVVTILLYTTLQPL